MIYSEVGCSWTKGSEAQGFEEGGECDDQLDTPALM